MDIFEILTLMDKKEIYQLVVKNISWDSLKRKLKQITKKTKPYSSAERLQKLK